MGKPRELWKSLKTLDLSSIESPWTNICLKTKNDVTNFDDKKNAIIFFFNFFFFFCTLAVNFLANLPPSSLRFGLHSVWQYYEKALKYPNSKYTFTFVSKETVLKFLQDLDLKNRVTVLGKPVSQIFNLSIKYSIFPFDCEIAK